MEQVAEQVVEQTTTGQGAEGTPQETQQTEQTTAPEVAPEKKDGEEHRSRQWRRLDRWRTRAIEAETRLKAWQETQQQVRQADQSPAKAADDSPQREQFGSYEEFLEARAAWRAEKAAEAKVQKALEDVRKKTDEERTSGDREKIAKAWNAQIEKARDELDDFDEVTAESEAPITQAMSEAIIESEHGARIAYHLAKNPAEAERISKLPKSKQAAEIVKLEEKLAKPPQKQTTKAPDPITPVGQKAEVHKDPAKMTQAQFNEWRRNGGK